MKRGTGNEMKNRKKYNIHGRTGRVAVRKNCPEQNAIEESSSSLTKPEAEIKGLAR